MKTCPDCNGDGVVDKDTVDERQCPTCGGLGFVADNDDEHEEVIETSGRSAAETICSRRERDQAVTLRHRRGRIFAHIKKFGSSSRSLDQ
jgi:DnaJ-class molecular chaperone